MRGLSRQLENQTSLSAILLSKPHGRTLLLITPAILSFANPPAFIAAHNWIHAGGCDDLDLGGSVMRLRAVLRERGHSDFGCSVLEAGLKKVVFME